MNQKPLRQILSISFIACLLAATAVNARAQPVPTRLQLTPESPLVAGDLDPSFGGFGGDGTVWFSAQNEYDNYITIQPDGKILVTGYNGSRNFIRRYNPDGRLDISFANEGEFNSSVDVVYWVPIVQPDGKIIAVSSAERDVNTDMDFILVRLRQDGQLDPDFGIGGYAFTDFDGGLDVAYDIALQEDGKIVVCGTARDFSVRADWDFAVARYQANGDLDENFGEDGKVTIGLGEGFDAGSALAIEPGGRIVIAGRTLNDAALTRLNDDGSLDHTFDKDGKVTTDGFLITDVVLQPDGKIIGVGVEHLGDEEIPILIRYSTDGQLDLSFGVGGMVRLNSAADVATAAALQPDGKLLVSLLTSDDIVVRRLNADGTLDISFDIETSFINNGYDMLLQPDGKVLVVATGGTGYRRYLVRYNPDGSLDQPGKVQTSFGPWWDRAFTLGVQPDGKILLAGDSNTNTLTGKDVALARYNPDGTPDQGFGAGGQVLFGTHLDDYGRAVALAASGKIVVGGFIQTASGKDFQVLRFHQDGSPDNSLNDLINFGYGDDEVKEVLLQQVGGQEKIVLVGSTRIGLILRKYGIGMARYNENGEMDTSFGGNGTGLVTTNLGDLLTSILVRGAAIQPDGKILVVGGLFGDFIAVRYNANGTLDNSFGGDGVVTIGDVCNDTANAVAILPDGVIVLAGELGFLTQNQECGNHDFGLAFLNADGSVCSNCSGSYGVPGLVRTNFGGDVEALAIAIQPDGKILVTGKKINYDPSGSPFYLARYRYKSVPVNARGYVLDTSFDGDGKLEISVTSQNEIWDMALDQQSRILVAGYSFNGNDYDFSLMRLLNDFTAPPPPSSDSQVFLPLVVR